MQFSGDCGFAFARRERGVIPHRLAYAEFMAAGISEDRIKQQAPEVFTDPFVALFPVQINHQFLLTTVIKRLVQRG